MSDQQETDNETPPDLGIVSGHTSRERRELEIIQSDRIQLVQEANSLIHTLIDKDIPTQSGLPQPVEWTEEERAAYNAALGFLTTQFKQGYKDSEIVERAKENEYHTLYQPQREPNA